MQVKKLAGIVALIIAFTGTNAQDPDDLYCRGVASLMTGNYSEAANFLTSAIKLEPNNALMYLKRGEAYYQSGLLDDALNDFLETDMLDKSKGSMGLARTYARLGNEEKSLFYLREHLNSGYHLKEKDIKKDSAFDKLQYTDGWYVLWQENWYTGEEEVESEVDYLLHKEQYLDALTLLDEKILKSENPHILYACRAKVYEELDNYKGAIADWDNAITHGGYIRDYYIERGKAYSRLGKYENAAGDFTKVLRNDPACFSLYIERANAYAQLKKYSLAIKDVETYLEYFDNDQNAIALCGDLYYLSGNYIEALKYYNRNLRLDKSKPEYYKARGKAYLKTGTYMFAINDLSMALDLYPNDGETYLLKGIALFESGDIEGACSDWNKARKFGEVKAVEYLLKYCDQKALSH
jgi:tetratricopeptide (TPR) repeat protein